MKLFCELLKDKKTLDILKKYIEDIEKGIDIFHEDCYIQKCEMETHIYLTGEDGIKWVKKYANGERIYLNTLKILAHDFELIFRFMQYLGFNFSSKDLTDDQINFLVHESNKLKDKTLDKIY